MKERAEFYESLRRIKEEKQRYAEMVERFYEELRECHPEWEMRRQAALQVCCWYHSSVTFLT
jgi:predicted CopG family antitoxin